jgi:hypothetical protein
MKIQFRAKVKDTPIILTEITAYSDGMIGMDDSTFEKQIESYGYKFSGEDLYKPIDDYSSEDVCNVMGGDNWIWLEEGLFVLEISIDGNEWEECKLEGGGE